MSIPRLRVRKIVSDVRACMKVIGVKVVFDHNNAFLDGGDETGSEAYFMDDPATVAVSTYGRTPDEWLPDLLHETSHAHQWAEDALVWRNCYIMGTDTADLAELWTNGRIELNTHQKFNVFNSLYNLELDAEIRAVKKMLYYGLNRYISIERYTQEAWAYVTSYMLAHHERSWLPADAPPYHIDAIVDLMPKTFAVSAREEICSQPGWLNIYHKGYESINYNTRFASKYV